MRKNNKLVYGVGINDADYVVCPTINGKQVVCPFYSSWQSMLERCYSSKCLAKRPTYMGCSVCDEWLTFSNYKRWMETQNWKGKEPDKDLLVRGNKVYSSETCVFLDQRTNKFILDSGAARGEHPIGVSLLRGKFQAQCKNPFTRKLEYLGLFLCPNQAHLAWKKCKHEFACQLAEQQQDLRVADALRQRYAPDRDLTK